MKNNGISFQFKIYMMQRIKVTRVRPNKLFESWLEEWRDEACARNPELEYHFSKALEAIRKYPLPLASGKDCILLQHFGTKLCAMIDKRLEQHRGQCQEAEIDLRGVITQTAHEKDAAITNYDHYPDDPCAEDVEAKQVFEESLREHIATSDQCLHNKNDDEVMEISDDEMDEPSTSQQARVFPIDDGSTDLHRLDEPYQPLTSAPMDDYPIPMDDYPIPMESPNCSQESEPDTQTLVRQSSFSFMPRSFDIILLVDTQEVKGKDKDDPVISQLTRESTPFEIRHLNVGDFAWIARCRNTKQELVLPYIVERKRIDDLAASIKDGRYHEQKFRLRQSGIPNVIYMIEKLPNGTMNTSLPLTTLLQAATNSVVQDGFTVRHTRNHRDSMLYLATFTSTLVKLFKDKILCECDKSSLAKRFDVNTGQMSLMEFEEFNKSSAKIKTLKVKDMFIKQLIQIKGLSLDGTLAIVDRYPTPQSLKRAIDAADDGEKLLATIQFGRTKRKLGPVIAKIIHQFYTQENLQ